METAYYGSTRKTRGTGGVDFTPGLRRPHPVFIRRLPTLEQHMQKTINYETEAGASDLAEIHPAPDVVFARYDVLRWPKQMKDDYLSSAGYAVGGKYQQGSAYASDDSAYSREELREAMSFK